MILADLQHQSLSYMLCILEELKTLVFGGKPHHGTKKPLVLGTMKEDQLKKCEWIVIKLPACVSILHKTCH